jgi:hypothetical protein
LACSTLAASTSTIAPVGDLIEDGGEQGARFGSRKAWSMLISLSGG